MNKPIVSIIIPCYNREKMLKECIESFLRQTFQNFEIIVVDDGSEKKLDWVIQIDNRIKYLRQDKNGYGADRARNFGLHYASGKFVQIFDSDDTAKNKFLEEQVNFLNQNLQYDCIYSDVIIKNITGGKEKCVFDDCDNTKEDYERMLQHQFIPHTSMWRKEKMLLHDETLPSASDWNLFLEAMEKGIKFYHLNKFLWIRRIGHNQESYSERQAQGCDILLNRRGYKFDKENRVGVKI